MTKRTPYTTGDVAEYFGTSSKTVRRHMRAMGIRCGSGARHTWDAKGYHDVVKTLEDNTSLTPAKPQTPRSRKAKPTDAPFQEAAGFDRPLNAILYGPPGTGKTYATARRCVDI